MIRSITEQTGAKIDVEDNGTVHVAAADGEAMRKAIERIELVTAVPEIGKIYTGTVRKIVDFGAFVQLTPGVEGLVVRVAGILFFRNNCLYCLASWASAISSSRAC